MAKSTLIVIESAFNQFFRTDFSRQINRRDDFDSNQDIYIDL